MSAKRMTPVDRARALASHAKRQGYDVLADLSPLEMADTLRTDYTLKQCVTEYYRTLASLETES